MKALDLFCAAGGISVGLARAGFEVTGVDSDPKCERYWRKGMEPYGGEFICADAMDVLDQILRAQRGATAPLCDMYNCRFDLIHASPPCQGYSVLRHLTKGKVYPDLVDAVRERLVATGALWCIENVEGAPLAVPPGGSLVLLCGTMFGLQTPDGRAEIRRHRLFETSFPIVLRPACQHGGTTMVVTGHSYQAADAHSRRRLVLSVVGGSPEAKLDGYKGDGTDTTVRRKVLCVAGGKAMSGGMMTPQGELKRRAMSITGHTAQTNVVRNQVRETFTIDDARAAMGIPWMPMRYLSQAIPPTYAFWIAEQAIDALAAVRPAAMLSMAGRGR